MPQTLLALFGLVLVMTFSLNQSRMAVQADETMMRNEVATMATGVVGEVFDAIGALPFDGNGDVSTPDQLTPAGGFGGVESWEAATDIDDLHDQSRTFEIATETGTIEIEVSVTVAYVRKAGAQFVPSSLPAYFKEVTLDVRGPLGYRARLARVYNYGSYNAVL